MATKRIDSMTDGSESPAERSRLLLETLARTLGCSPADFFGGTAPDHIADAEELLRLWFSIESPTDRLRVLDFARAVKVRADAKPGD